MSIRLGRLRHPRLEIIVEMLPAVDTTRTFCGDQAKGTPSVGGPGAPGTGPDSGTDSCVASGACPRVGTPRRIQVLPQPALDRRTHPRLVARPSKKPRPGLADTLRKALAWKAELASRQVKNRAATCPEQVPTSRDASKDSPPRGPKQGQSHPDHAPAQ
jgi:hypothetical protein